MCGFIVFDITRKSLCVFGTAGQVVAQAIRLRPCFFSDGLTSRTIPKKAKYRYLPPSSPSLSLTYSVVLFAEHFLPSSCVRTSPR